MIMCMMMCWCGLLGGCSVECISLYTCRHTLNQGPLKIKGKAASSVNGGIAVPTCTLLMYQFSFLLCFQGFAGNVGANFIRFYNIYSASAASGEFEKVANGAFCCLLVNIVY